MIVVSLERCPLFQPLFQTTIFSFFLPAVFVFGRTGWTRRGSEKMSGGEGEEFLDREWVSLVKYVPMRLTDEERKLLVLLEVLEFSNYLS
jgi:hypothetical protein